MYDVGSGQLVEKTKNKDHGDSVTDAAINPRFYEWATSSIDGHVRVYRHPAVKMKGKPPSFKHPGQAERPNVIKLQNVVIEE